ncbi:MAG: hypothetical protein ACOYLE_01580 [Bacteroidales bacterium]
MQTAIEINRLIVILNKEIVNKISVPENNRFPIFDGAVNIDEYLNSKIKIAWLLREPYESANAKSRGWFYSDLFNDDNLYNNFFGIHNSRTTWHQKFK